ncbi:MAG: ankyrin repeat domain-containing protein [Gammaproteobacteria bacterium]|nr:ankyrin repeat domain-containing protein [Gammaproteobacteria bacterium]
MAFFGALSSMGISGMQKATAAIGMSEMQQAAFMGNLKEVCRLLLKGDNPNEEDADGETPLDAAARKGRDDIVAVLVKNGAQVNHIVDTKRASISLAALTGRIATILFRAIDAGHLKSAQILLNNGADPFYGNKVKLMEFLKFYYLPYHIKDWVDKAEVKSYVKAIAAIEFDEKFPDNFFQRLAIIEPSIGESISKEETLRVIIQAILAQYARMQIASPLIKAAAKKEGVAALESVIGKTMFQLRDNEGYYTEESLLFNAMKQVIKPEEDAFYRDPGQELLSRSLSEYSQVRSKIKAFKLVYESRKAECDELLRSYQLKSDSDLPSPEKALRRAAHIGKIEPFEKLISHVKHIDEPDSGDKKRAALHWAVIDNFQAAVALLLKAGANPDILDGLGKSARTYANELSDKTIASMMTAIPMPTDRAETVFYREPVAGGAGVCADIPPSNVSEIPSEFNPPEVPVESNAPEVPAESNVSEDPALSPS